jgi:hypothetical protein
MMTIALAGLALLAAAGSKADAQLVCGSANSGLLGNNNQYMFLGDQWNPSFTYVDQCVQITNSTTPPPTTTSGTGAGPSSNYSSGTFNNTTDTPSDYPDFLYGAFQGNSTSNTQLPLAVTSITGSTPKYKVLSGENVVEPSGYNNDMAYDIWFNTYAGTPANQNTTGTELMIWVQHNGSAGTISGGPTYSFTDPTTGQGWTAYTGTNGGNCNCTGTGSQVISFVRNNSDGPTPAGGLTEALNLDDFFTEALNVGQIQSSWYLTAVEFGTEIWVGGPGLEVNNFWVNVVANSGSTGGGTSGAEAAYGGTAVAIPGTVQAENYDTGGQGTGYSVSSVNGTGNSYRSDGVDLEATTDSGAGYDLGWTAAGQWFRYTVNVATAGTYTVTFRVAAPGAVSDAFHIANSAGSNLSGSVSVPATGGWQTWTNVTATVTLPAGTQTLTIAQDAAGWNINYATFASSSNGSTVATGTPFNLVNENSGLCMDASGWGTANGTIVQQWACAQGTYSVNTNQQWEFTSAGSGNYEITNVNASAQALNIAGDAVGSLLQTWTYDGASNENFMPVSDGNGYYHFVVQQNGLCLDTPAASTANGVQLQEYTCNGTAAQQWKLVTP